MRGPRREWLQKVLTLRGARLGMDHYVERTIFADALFDRITQRVNLFEAGGSRHADGGVHKMPVACAAHADAIDVELRLPYARWRERFPVAVPRVRHRAGRLQCGAEPRNLPTG